MTDTRLPEHYLTAPAIDGLSDPAYRVFVSGLMWSNTHGTDGALPVRSLRWLHVDATKAAAAADELVASGLWATAADGWTVPDFLKHQTSAAEVQAGRDAGALKKRRQRAHARGDHSLCSPGTCDVVRMSRGDRVPSPGVTPEDRTGQDSSRGDQQRNYRARTREEEPKPMHDPWPDEPPDLDWSDPPTDVDPFGGGSW